MHAIWPFPCKKVICCQKPKGMKQRIHYRSADAGRSIIRDLMRLADAQHIILLN